MEAVYATNLALDTLMGYNVRLSYRRDSKLLTTERDGLMMVVLPRAYGMKSAKGYTGWRYCMDGEKLKVVRHEMSMKMHRRTVSAACDELP